MLKFSEINIWYLIAGILAFSVCLLHIFLGGKEAARPLLNTTALNSVAKYTNYYCWHMVSITIAALGIMFICSGLMPQAYPLAYFATILAGLFSVWNLTLYFAKRKEFRVWYALPQWLLFLPIAVFGLIGGLNG